MLRPIRDRAHFAERAHLFEASIIIGIAGGLGAALFRECIRLMKSVFFGMLLPAISFKLAGLNPAVIILPLAGALLSGPMVYFLAREAKGHGVPEIIEALIVHKGKMRPIVALVKTVASAITIGSGGSSGKEGPIAQIGGVFGSVLGGKLFKGAKEVKTCVVCGVAAGISGTFNAPLGGAIFAMEIVGGGMTLTSPIPVLISSALGNVVTGMLFGFTPVFTAPQYSFGQAIEIPLFIILGLLFGLIAFAWQTVFYFAEGSFESMRIPQALIPAVGGLLTGVVGMFFFGYDVLGGDYGTITRAMGGTMMMGVLVCVGLAKMLATAFTIGSGGSGGVFAPTLFIGTMFGTAFGLLANSLFPNAVPQATAFGLVGMGALFAGAFRGPITALILIPEMTNNYHLLIPMALASTLSYAVASQLKPDSFYHTKILRKGIIIPHHPNPLEDIPISEVMETDVVSVRPNTSMAELLTLMLETRHPGYPVVDDTGNYLGYVSIFDLKKIHPEKRKRTKLEPIIQKDYPTLTREDTVYHAINMMARHDIGRIPILETKGGKRVLIGIFSKTDVVRAYKKIVE